MNLPAPPPMPAPPNYTHTSQTANLILTLITCGLWAPVWILLMVLESAGNASKRKAYELQYQRHQQYMAWLNYQNQIRATQHGTFNNGSH